MTDLLTPEEQELFRTPGRFMARHLVEVKAAHSGPRSPRKLSLIDTLLNKLEQLHSRRSAWFASFSILADESDGMSWSVAAICDAVAKSYEDLELWTIRGQAKTDGAPTIAEVIGEKTFLKLAYKSQLLASGRYHKWWMTPLIMLALIALGILAEAARLAIASPNPAPLAEVLPKELLNPYFLLSAVVVVGLGLVGQHLVELTGTGKGDGLSTFLDKFNVQHESKHYATLREILAQHLAANAFPRFVVVDGFSRLDSLTQAVIDRYFQKYSDTARGSEMWVVFDEKETNEFGRLAGLHSGSFGYQRCEQFQQVLLSDGERQELARKCGYPDRADYTTVKHICHPEKGFDNSFVTLFNQYRKEHPRGENQYGDAELFFLLALTSLHGSPFFGHLYLRSNLSKSSSKSELLRKEVLKNFLYGGELKASEFRVQLAQLAKHFQRFLSVQGEGDSREFRIKKEAAIAIVNHQKEFGLPDRRIGHLYWALFWYEKLKSHPLQSFWIRKLAFHIVEAEPATILAQPFPEGAATTLFEATLFTIRGSLQVCLLGPIPGLMEVGLTLLDHKELQADAPTRAEALSREGWNAFAVWGNDEVLGYILELQALKRGEEEAETPAFDLLTEIFLNSFSASPERRGLLRREFSQLQGEIGEVIHDYAQARAAWLALSIPFHSEALPIMRLARGYIATMEVLPHILNKAVRRMQSLSPASLPATELLVISTSLWGVALQLQKLGLAGKLNLADLLGIIENVLALASRLRESGTAGGTTPFGIDFLLQGFLEEIAVIALVVLRRLDSRIANNGSEEDALEASSFRKRTESLASLGTDLLQIKLPWSGEEESSEAWSRGLALPALIWSKLDLAQLEQLANIRKLQFQTVSRASAVSTSYRSALELLGDTLEKKSFLGLLGNLAVTDSLQASGELSAHFGCQAAVLAMTGSCGEELIEDLCIMALGEAHVYSFDLTFIFEYMLGSSGTGVTRLSRFLFTLPDDQLSTVCLWLTNGCKKTKSPHIAASTLSDLMQRISVIKEPDPREEAQEILELFDIQMRVERGESIEWTQVREQWKDRRGSWLYPVVLRRQLDVDKSPELLMEGLSVLREAPAPAKGTPYIFLALSLGKELLANRSDQRGLETIVFFFTRNLDYWESRLSVESNSDVFRFLTKADSKYREQYMGRLLKWEAVRLDRDALKRLPYLLEQGSYFLIFFHYFEALFFWGLRTEISNEEWTKLTRRDDNEKKQLALDWKRKGARVPDVFLAKDHLVIVSSKFLLLGNVLFSPPNDLDPEFEEDRRRFNQVAMEAISKLFDLAMHLDGLPGTIREILRGHSEQLLHYTLPA